MRDCSSFSLWSCTLTGRSYTLLVPPSLLHNFNNSQKVIIIFLACLDGSLDKWCESGYIHYIHTHTHIYNLFVVWAERGDHAGQGDKKYKENGEMVQ